MKEIPEIIPSREMHSLQQQSGKAGNYIPGILLIIIMMIGISQLNISFAIRTKGEIVKLVPCRMNCKELSSKNPGEEDSPVAIVKVPGNFRMLTNDELSIFFSTPGDSLVIHTKAMLYPDNMPGPSSIKNGLTVVLEEQILSDIMKAVRGDYDYTMNISDFKLKIWRVPEFINTVGKTDIIYKGISYGR